eukprot:gene22552-1341_t
MGGGWYDRDVYEANSPTATGVAHDTAAQWSAIAEQKLVQKGLHEGTNPRGRRVRCVNTTPIVCALDVTGSMGNWTKIIFDKLPMFYGQILMHQYTEDPAMCFCGVGDAYTDE